MAKATDYMVVDHACRLHVSVDDRCSDEAEAALLKVLADQIGQIGASRDVAHRLEVVHDGFAVHKAPDVVVKASKLLLDAEERLRIADGGSHLCPVADDALVARSEERRVGKESRA